MRVPCFSQEIATLKAKLQLAKAQASKQGRLLRVKEEEARVSNEVRPGNNLHWSLYYLYSMTKLDKSPCSAHECHACHA